ncbi:regulatory protein RecX [Paenibacillus guangzhouensis]|uniref:regulatory protein RecX n=1 Tax=Paenibacillus guangzhouensis TaxID=1473112 RepID=UPI0012668B7D|nr:RecX family transcriptional regulator [Paenibacillus guangzhouensis]
MPREKENDDQVKEQKWAPAPGVELMITAVELVPRKKRRYQIFVNGEPAFTVHEDIMVKYRLLKGSTIDHEELLPIMVADELQQAYVQSIRYLGRKPRTSHEIQQQLTQKGFEAELIERVIQRLRDERLIDDNLYAKQWTDQRVRNHKKGRLMIKHELQQKGIDKSDIAQAMEELNVEDEQESAYRVGLRKWQSTKGERYERKRKVAAFLMRRGFPSHVVRNAVQRIMEQQEDDDGYDGMEEAYEEEFYD